MRFFWILQVSLCCTVLLLSSSRGGVKGHEEEEGAGNINNGDPECPIYRWFDDFRPNHRQHNAPNGCFCIDGMRGLNCGYCESDEPCQQVNKDHVCRKGMFFSVGDSYKSYSCRLTDQMQNLFTNGKVDVFVNVTSNTTEMIIYNGRDINEGHAVGCFLTGCIFAPGERSGDCDNVDCKCTDMCSPIVKPIVEDSLSNKPAKFVIVDDSVIDVQIQGSLFEIKAICNASSCTPDVNVTLEYGADTEFASATEAIGNRGIDWDPTTSYALIALLFIFAVFLLMTFCAGMFLFTGRKDSEKHSTSAETSTGQEEGSEEDLFPPAMRTSSNDLDSKDVLEFKHIIMSIDMPSRAARFYGKQPKKILKDLSGSVESGHVMGIMGPSGSGKSSLLNTLAAVKNRGATASGQILLNGRLLMQGYRNIVAYVQQADTLYNTLTVRECIEYSAFLRLSRRLSTQEKEDQVNKTLQELHLEKVANSRIESISGGERRRVSIGMELVNEPRVLMLDEPTSGLDSSAANSIMSILSELASRGRIVILSIHQPSVKSFLRMDQIMLLAEGRVMYSGKTSEAVNYFEEHGFSCPEHESISDFLLDTISERLNHDILAGPEIHEHDYEKILETMRSAEQTTAFSPLAQYNSLERRSIFNECAVLFARAAKDIIRNRTLFFMQLFISVILALFAGGIFNNVSNDLAGFQNRMGAFYFTLSFFGFASFSSMDMFVREREIFIREVGSKYYRTYTYFITKVVLDTILLRAIPATVFSFVFYWLMSLTNAFESFIVFWATLVLFNVCSGMISICISIATPTVGQANLLAAVWFLIMLLFGGFLVNVETMSLGYSWLKYLSIFYYSFELLMTNELSGLLLSFNAPGYPAIPVYGEVFLQTLGMDVDNQIRDFVCLCSLAAGFMLVAYALLLMRAPRSAAKHFRNMEKTTKKFARTESQQFRSASIPPERESTAARDRRLEATCSF